MALRKLAKEAVTGLGLRSGAPVLFGGSFALRSLAVRGFATVEKGLLYQSSHEWTNIEGDTATVGISDFAQEELGDVVYVELPEVGSQLAQGDTFGVVESVKAASDVYAPMSGEVVEVNNSLVDDPALVNSQPFGGGWMMKIKLSDPSQKDSLLTADKYEEHCAAGGH